MVISGTTSGNQPSNAELTKIFFKPLRVIGSTMGTRDELLALTRLLVTTGAVRSSTGCCRWPRPRTASPP